MSLRGLVPAALVLLLAAACCPVLAPESEQRTTAFTATVIGPGVDGLEVMLDSGRSIVLVGDIAAAAGTELYVTGTMVEGGRVIVLHAAEM